MRLLRTDWSLPASCCALLLAAGVTSQSPVPKKARPADASALFRAMAAMTGLEARFEEEKHVSLLAAPLRSKGRLYFLRDPGAGSGHLARIVDEPEKSTLLITPKELHLQNRDGTEVIDLRRSDKVRTFVTSLVHVFAGDEAALAKSYTITFEPDPASESGWTLALVPRDKPLNQLLKSLRLHGEGEAVVRIEVHEPNGDRTLTRITSADPARRFDAAEQKQLFGIGKG
jgi:hypothetical protein